MSPNLFCGSQPQSPEDIQRLRDDVGIGTVVNLQQDKDFAYWNVDFGAYQHRASQIGLDIIRCPVRCLPPYVTSNDAVAVAASASSPRFARHRYYGDFGQTQEIHG